MVNAQGGSSLKSFPWLPHLAIFLLAVAVHLGAVPGHFFMDDLIIVRDNPLLQSPSLKSLLLFDYWGPSENSGLYRPLTILSFIVNRALLGPEAWGYHWVNLLLHGGVAVLLYRFLGCLDMSAAARWFAGALFAVHPIHGEAVNELVGRSELLVALLLLLGLILSRGEESWRLPAVGVSFLGALLTKEHGIVFLALLPAVDFYLTRNPAQVLRQRRILYPLLLAIAAAWLLFRRIGIQRPFLDVQRVYDPFYVPLSTLDGVDRILAALKVQLLYLAKMLVPHSLQGMYPQSTVLPAAPVFSLWTLAILAVLLTLAAAGWWGWRHRQVWALALVGYVISFAPTSNLAVLTEVTMAERLAYLPSLWFCVGLAALVGALPFMHEKRFRLPVLSAVLLIFSLLGVARSLDFRTPERLWRNDLRINPHNELSTLFLADELWRQGQFVEAEREYQRLVGFAPRFCEGLRTYAAFLLERGNAEAAIDYAKRALATGVGRYMAAYMPLADAYIETGRLHLAYEALEKGRATHEYRAIYWEVLGKFYEAKGDLLAAVQAYEKALKAYGPWSNDTLLRLGKAYLELGHHGKAEEVLRRDVLQQGGAEGYNSLGIALAMQGKQAEARLAFAKAVELQPDSMFYRSNLERLGQ